MKKMIRLSLMAVATALVASFTVACDESITEGIELGDGMETIYENNLLLQDAATNTANGVVSLTATGATAEVRILLTKAAEKSVVLTPSLDPSYLTTYNKKHDTSYTAYPVDAVSFDGDVVIEAGKKEATFTVTLAPAELDAAMNYALPIKVATADASLTLKENASHCIFGVMDERETPNCDKGGEVKGYLFFEVNDQNPLNAFAFQLENGKYLWDIVVLFAANINWDDDQKRAYIYCNPQVQFLIDNNDEYIQPLRKAGMKVLVALLGNHDATGLAQLSAAGCKDFAAQISQFCAAHRLDGVLFDDEYSNSPDLTNPYLTTKSTANAARLCMETKKAMPDKLVTVYDWGSMYGTATVDGIDADDFIDIVVDDYGQTAYPLGNMSKKKCSYISMEFNLNRGGSWTASTVESMVSGGYGWFMGFAPYMEPAKGKYTTIFSRVSGGCEAAFGSPLKAPFIYYMHQDATPYHY